MITALFGFVMGPVLMQGDTFREHIREIPIIQYIGDDDSWLYARRQSRFVVGGVEWTTDAQYSRG